MKRPALAICLTTLLALAATGCSLRRPAPLARLQPTVRSDMSEMARSILDIEAILQHDESLTPGDYDQIVDHLGRLQTITQRLEPARLGHPGLQQQLPVLRDAATEAVAGARASPPSMEGFDRLRGVCNGCHANPL